MRKLKRKQPWETPIMTIEETAEEALTAEESVGAAEEDREPTAAPSEAFATAAELAVVCETVAQLREELAELHRQTRVAAVNERNRERSAGRLAPGEGENYFTPEEVRAMSGEAVRANYDHIIDSMKHWH